MFLGFITWVQLNVWPGEKTSTSKPQPQDYQTEALDHCTTETTITKYTNNVLIQVTVLYLKMLEVIASKAAILVNVGTMVYE